MYRPKPHILISINSDGSGSIKQYDNYDAAKEAYDALSVGTISAFIYAKPNKSLATGAIGSPVAIPAKVNFTPIQNLTAVYNPGNPSFSAPHPVLAQFSAPTPTGGGTPPLPRVTDSGIFGDNDQYRQWQIFCSANPSHPQCTVAGNPQFGTLVSSECAPYENAKDANDVVWPMVYATKVNKYANGLGGTYEEVPFPTNSALGGCFYPQGYATTPIDFPLYFDNSNGSGGIIDIAIRTYNANGDYWTTIEDLVFADSWTVTGIQDGQGNEKMMVVAGLPPLNFVNAIALMDYPQGSLLRKATAMGEFHPGSIQGWLVNNTPAQDPVGGLAPCRGKWLVDFNGYRNTIPPLTEAGQNLGTYPRGVFLRFRYKPEGSSISPFETVPPTNHCGRAIKNEFTGETTGIDSSETIEPEITLEFEYQNVSITEMDGMEVPCGQKQKATMIKALDGPYVSAWSDMHLYSAGTTLASDSMYYYKATGDGGYYSELISSPPPCPSAGTFLSYGSEDIELALDSDNAPIMVIGTQFFDVIADGNCGGTEQPGQQVFKPHATYLGHGDTLKYYSNGEGGYYTEPRFVYPEAGTDLGTFTQDPIYDNGSGFQVGYQNRPNIADGNGGSTPGAGSFVYYGAGTMIGTSNGTSYFSDGMGGVYSQSATPTGYQGDESYITIPSGQNVLSGTRVRPQYGDGSYGDWTSWNYTANGTLYGSDATYNYFADGAGSYYSEAQPTCDPSGYHYSNEGPLPLNYDAGCGPVQIGTYYQNTYADGSCGTYTTQDAPSITPGDFTTCNGNIYSVDSTGSVTSRSAYTDNGGGGSPTYPSAGTYISSYCATQAYTDVMGSGWSTPAQYIEVLADGMGGSYENNVGSNMNGCYYPSGYAQSRSQSGSASGNWQVDDQITLSIAAQGSYEPSTDYYVTYADGAGGSYTNYWPTTVYLPEGAIIAQGTYTNNDGFEMSYVVTATSMGGYSVAQQQV